VTATELADALTLAGLSAPVSWHEVTGSTNAVAAGLADEGAPEWALVGAAHQTAGRGRLGRTWQDRAGGAVMVSIVLRPSLPPEQLGLLTLLAGAAWAEAASEVARLEIRCKWPNDLMSGEDKVGGVLAESSMSGERVRWVVIGSGVNLVAPDVERAAGLGDIDRVQLFGTFLSRFRSGYSLPAHELPGHVRVRWSAVSATLGRDVAALASDGVRRHGVAVEIDEIGRLVLDTADGRIVVAADDIEHLR